MNKLVISIKSAIAENKPVYLHDTVNNVNRKIYDAFDATTSKDSRAPFLKEFNTKVLIRRGGKKKWELIHDKTEIRYTNK